MKSTLALALLLASAVTHADSKAWTTAKKIIPANEDVVAGVNVMSAHSSALYQTLVPMALAKAGGAGAKLDAIKADCGINVLDAVDSFVVGVDAQETTTLVIAFHNTSRPQLESCLKKEAQAKGEAFAISADGPLTKYSGKSPTDTLYARWYGSDVVAIVAKKDSVGDRDAALAATGGGVANDARLRGLDAVNTGATIWGVSTKGTSLPTGGAVVGGYGSAAFSGGTIAIDIHMTTDSAKSATTNAQTAQQQLAAARGQAMFADLLKTTKIAAVGSEIQITAQVPEKAVLQLFTMFAGGMGGGGMSGGGMH